MKSVRLLILIPVLGLAPRMWAQFPPRHPEQVAMKIVQTDNAEFPLALRNTPITSGDAWVVVNVDSDGNLIEVLVTGFSRKDFAETAVAALHRWRYEPARLNGETWPSVQEVHFDFSRSGVVIDVTAIDMLQNRTEELIQGRYIYRAYALRELDRIPMPIHVVSPVPPVIDPKEGTHRVLVDFYIDEEGNVRMPSVAREKANDACAASAMAAVKEWRFEPPLCRGKPVLVHAQQPFNFVPKELAGK